MGRVEFGGGRIRATLTFATIAGAIAIGGCSADGTSSLSSFTDRFKQASAAGTDAQSSSATASTTVSYCPPVDVRTGASSLAFSAAGAEGAMGLRYQATLGQTARECHAVGGNLNMKVGVQGRMILGPAGGPGTVEVPLRLALVHEGPSPKTLWTKLYRIPVTMPDGTPHVAFTLVEEDLTVPMPAGGDIESYVVYIGFDALGAKTQPQKNPPQRKRAQPTG